MTEPTACSPPPELFRVGRSGEPLRHSTIRPEDARLRAGNRFDVPGGGVLYLASTRAACFGETLARYRTSPAMLRLLAADDEEGFMKPRTVPQDWRLQRRMVTVEIDPSARFIDVDTVASVEWLRQQLEPYLTATGRDDFDLSDLHSRDRELTRLVAAAVWNSTNDEGELQFDGIRYQSRIDKQWDCWAVFEGTQVRIAEEQSIERADPDLQQVAEAWQLRVF